MTLIIVMIACSSKSISIKKLLPPMTSTVVIYENVIIENPRLIELQNIFTKSIQENYDWFVEYGKKNNFPLPYHQNMGLTKNEYEELQKLYKNTDFKLQESGKETITVIHDDNFIHFSSSGILEFFNDITINLSDTTIQMVDNTLKFQKIEIVTDSKNIFNSPWIGYSWRYNYPENYESMSSDYIKMGLVKYYTFTIGKIEKTGKTFMLIKGVERNNGEKYIDFEAPIIFE